jgi:hypothetical protein
MNGLLIQLLIPLLVTEAVETPIYWAFFQKKGPGFVLGTIGLNVVTNIAFNLILTLQSTGFLAYLWKCAVGEVLIFLVEGTTIGLMTREWGRAFLSSLAANIASLLLGLIYNLIYTGADTTQIEILGETYLLVFGLGFVVEIALYIFFSVKRTRTV